MNKQIFELAKQADLIQWETLPSGVRTPDHESVVKANKFAELIVRECVEQIYPQWIKDHGYIEPTNLADAVMRVKEHFGVEE